MTKDPAMVKVFLKGRVTAQEGFSFRIKVKSNIIYSDDKAFGRLREARIYCMILRRKLQKDCCVVEFPDAAA